MSRISAPSASLVRAVVLGTIAVTLFHFTDNAVNVDTYPKAGWQPDWFEWVVVAAWFLYTGFGVAGVRAYQQGRFGRAHAYLILYGYMVFSSLGHFIYGSPTELTTRGLVSVFVDTAAGSVVIGLTIWSIVARRAAAKTAPAQ
jgi:hypothetical protein